MRNLALLPLVVSPVGCGKQTATAPMPAARAAEKLANLGPGTKITLSRAEGSGRILIAIDKGSFVASSEWKSKGTEALLIRLRDQKRVFEVEPATDAGIEESESGRRLGRILGGLHKDEKGWIVAEDVVESRQ